MAKIELFLVDDADETSESFAIEGDFDDMREIYAELKEGLEECTSEEPESSEGTSETSPEVEGSQGE